MATCPSISGAHACLFCVVPRGFGPHKPDLGAGVPYFGRKLEERIAACSWQVKLTNSWFFGAAFEFWSNSFMQQMRHATSSIPCRTQSPCNPWLIRRRVAFIAGTAAVRLVPSRTRWRRVRPQRAPCARAICLLLAHVMRVCVRRRLPLRFRVVRIRTVGSTGLRALELGVALRHE